MKPSPQTTRCVPTSVRERIVQSGPAWLAAVILTGCTAGNGDGLDASGRPLAEGGNVPLAPTFESVQANVFDPHCVVCHAGAVAPLGLRLDAGSSYNQLVGVASRQSTLLRVDPGAPGQSYLVRKLEGTASEGGQMPLGGPPLPQSTIDFVRQWITDGALPGSGSEGGLPPRISSVDPFPGAVLATLPATLEIGFDRDIDASTINPMTVELVRSGGDGDFGNGNEVTIDPVNLSLSTVNPRLATMDFAGMSGEADRYRVTVRGSGASRVLGINGLALDGEFSGTLPSGDGAEAGDFVAEFEIASLLPTLDTIQSNVFATNCAVSGCHSGPQGPGLPGGMDLSTADSSFAALVGVASVQVPSLQRIAAGDADASYLVRKLKGTAAVGTQMPQFGTPLDSPTINAIRRWIDDGALR